MKKLKVFMIIATLILTIVPSFTNLESQSQPIEIRPMIDDGWPGHG